MKLQEVSPMLNLLQTLNVLLVAVAMGLSLAHALELPGKLRLTQDESRVVQPIYYPGFTIGGIAEPLSLLATTVLLILTPLGSRAFWLTLVALVGLIGMQTVYWVVTHPVNKVWMRGEALEGASAEFFALGPTEQWGPDTNIQLTDWRTLRNRREYSHVARACLGLLSLATLVVATT
jgi:hypothetical protein